MKVSTLIYPLIKRLFILLLITPLLAVSQAQTCTGNLGANIFEDGDFGSGAANILQDDPGIAPGYIYTTNTPPDDGYYTITNNMQSWPFFNWGWFLVPDNSPDPQGYMMVVNASYSAGLFYDQTIDGLCENTLYEFSADIINVSLSSENNRIFPNVSFLLDNTTFITTGNIANDQKWHTYGFTFTTDPGQTSVRLSLRNNAPGGFGNDLALDNISFRACGPEALILPREVANICEDGNPINLDATIVGEQYDNPVFQWQSSSDGGQTWTNIPGANQAVYPHTQTSSGFYYYRYLIASEEANLQNSKCRIISNVKLVHVVPKFYEISDSLCQGLSYEIGGNVHTESGVFIDSLISSLGCDSIVTLNLVIVPDSGIELIATATDLSCHDSSDGTVELNDIINRPDPISILFTDADQNPLSSFVNLPAGNYLLKVSDRFGCFGEKELTVNIPAEFMVDLGPDFTLLLGDPVQLDPQANYPVASYTWTPSGLFDCTDGCLQPLWYPLENTALLLSVVSENGCLATDSIVVEIDDTPRVYIPNVFSPNFDGINDRFTVFGHDPGVSKIKQLRVFNRWGAVVYEQKDLQPNDLSTGWDGTIKGKKMEEGIYVYLTEIELINGTVKTLSGDIMLIR